MLSKSRVREAAPLGVRVFHRFPAVIRRSINECVPGRIEAVYKRGEKRVILIELPVSTPVSVVPRSRHPPLTDSPHSSTLKTDCPVDYLCLHQLRSLFPLFRVSIVFFTNFPSHPPFFPQDSSPEPSVREFYSFFVFLFDFRCVFLSAIFGYFFPASNR